MTALSGKAVWLLNRVAAALVASALTGLIAGIVLYLIVLSAPRPAGSIIDPKADLVGATVWFLTWATYLGAVVGLVPGTLVMCLSSAKIEPWRSIPKILVGTTVGWLVCAMPFGFQYGTELIGTLVMIGSVVGPTVGALLVLRFWPTAQPRKTQPHPTR